jgi:DNA-binding HxlR family transcriptional regulator
MALLDLLGRRMALRVIWELRDGALTFRALADAAGANPSVLNARLKELRDAGVIERSAEGYTLTREGRDLREGLAPLRAWADKWARRAGA